MHARPGPGVNKGTFQSFPCTCTMDILIYASRPSSGDKGSGEDAKGMGMGRASGDKERLMGTPRHDLFLSFCLPHPNPCLYSVTVYPWGLLLGKGEPEHNCHCFGPFNLFPPYVHLICRRLHVIIVSHSLALALPLRLCLSFYLSLPSDEEVVVDSWPWDTALWAFSD